MTHLARRVLLVEDEALLSLTIADRLRSEGFVVTTEGDGEGGFQRARSESFDLIVLDVGLPLRNGFDVCRDLRQEGVGTPILMLTARTQVIDKVVGLKLGADDYLTKPFDVLELLARVEALLRRGPARNANPLDVYTFGSVRVDFRRAQVTRDGIALELSGLELKLLRYLIENRGALITRDELLDKVWGYQSTPTTRTVDVRIASLRQKIETHPSNPEFIVTVHRLGYKFTG